MSVELKQLDGVLRREVEVVTRAKVCYRALGTTQVRVLNSNILERVY
jgi:hypothetical protein